MIDGRSLKQVDGIMMDNYNMGLITNNERYNQVIDIWTHRPMHELTGTYQ